MDAPAPALMLPGAVVSGRRPAEGQSALILNPLTGEMVEIPAPRPRPKAD